VSSAVFTISSEPSATADETTVVRDGLHRFNFDTTGRTQYQDITLFVRDGARAIRGGLLGYVWGEWLHVTDLWVAEECRKRGLGGQLLARAEREAAAFGARGAFLSTFDFQAPDFYRARGYEVYGALRDYPPGHTEYHLRKMLQTTAGAAEQANAADEER